MAWLSQGVNHLSVGTLRKQLFGISTEESRVERRGFHPVTDPVRDRLETIGRTFIHGYHSALLEGISSALAYKLDEIEPELRGFAYEGAGMGLALLDALTPWRDNRFERFLQGDGAGHCYMLHVGAGWAWARLPFGLSHRIKRLDPLLRWLAFDGYGFHQGYFHWRQAIDNHVQPRRIEGYGRNAFDQGLGRSVWFAKGADPRRVADCLRSFPLARQGDLWSGVGLASSYAGGVAASELTTLYQLAGEFRPLLAQGSAFAAKARQRAGNPAPHTEMAARIFCHCDAATAAAVTDTALLNLPADGDLPAYELWRQRIQQQFQGD